jgi:two-component system, cell cycle sensor histidine kinase and response regulator CckA
MPAQDSARPFEWLARLGQAVSASQDLPEVLDTIARATLQFFPGACTRLWVAEGDRLYLCADAGAPADTAQPAELASGEGLTGQVALTRESVIVEDIPGDSFVGIPLVAKDRLVGVLSLATHRTRAFAPGELEVLGAFGGQAAIAIENARLNSGLGARGRRLQTMTRLNQLISSTLDPQEVLREVAGAAAKLTDAAVAAFWRADNETRTLHLVAYSEPVMADFPVREMRYDHGVLGWVATHRQTANVPDVFADARFVPVEWWRTQGLRSLLAVPVLLDDTLFAVLALNGRGPFRLESEDQELLESFVAQAAVAMRNAQLFDNSERRRQLAEALETIGRDLARSLDPAVVSKRILENLATLLGAHTPVLYRIDPDSGNLVAAAMAHDLERVMGPDLVVPRGIGCAGQAVEERRPVATPNVLTDPRIPLTPALRARLEQIPYRAVLSVPLIVKDRVIGALAVTAETGRVFDNRQISLVQAFADQAALALDNADLLHQTRIRQARLEGLLDVTRQLSGIQSLESLLESIAGACGRLLASATVRLHLVEGEQLIVAGTWGDSVSAIPAGPVTVGQGLSGRVATTGRPLIVANLPDHPALTTEQREAARQLGHRAWLGVPVKIGDRVAGVLSIRSTREHGFSEGDVTIAMAFASQAAVALENARHFMEATQRRREAEELAHMARTLTESLDPATVGQRIVDSVLTLFGGDSAILRLVRPSGALVGLAAAGRYAGGFEAGETIPAGVGMVGRAVAERRAVTTTDVLLEPLVKLTPAFRERIAALGQRAVAAAPLRVKGEILGVLAVVDVRPRAFTEADLALLQAFADQAALALENARLFAAQREEAEISGALLRLAQAVEGVQDLEHILDTVARIAPQLLGLARCGLLLFDSAESVLVPSTAWGFTEAQRAAFQRLEGVAQIPAVVEAIRSHEPVVVEDASEGTWLPAAVIEALDIRSLLIIPLVSAGRFMGAMMVDTPGEPKTFADKLITLARGIAAHAAGAVDRAGLHEETERRRREAEIFAELARTINESLNLETVLVRVGEWARELCRSDAAIIALRDPETGHMMYRHRFGSDGAMVSVSAGKGAGGQVLLTGRPFRTANYRNDPRISGDFAREARAAGTVAVLVVPIHIASRIEGLLYVVNQSRRFFSARDETILTRLGEHAAIAIHNGQLFAREEGAQRFLQSTLDALSAHIAVLDESGRIVAVNQAWRRFAERNGFRARDGGLGLNYVEVCQAASGPEAAEAQRVAEAFREVAAGARKEFLLEYTCHSPQEQRWFLLRMTSFDDAGRGRVVVAHEDVTERRLAEEALRSTEEHVRQVQKMEAIGRLAGGVAHDFNNLLTVIIGRSQMIMRRMGDDADPVRRDIALIHKTAERAGALTGQLLAFSRKQVLQPKVVSLNEIVEGLAPMLLRLLGEDVDLLIVPGAGSSTVKADRHQLEQVIVNLAVNGRDAMPRGGRLMIEISGQEVDAAVADQHGGSPGKYVVLAVSDAGTGIDPETLSKIFEPFFTTKAASRGTGLGLATVYGIVKQHQGFVAVDSELGHGTTFRVYLPATSERSEAVVIERSARPAGTETVLLVEDEDEVRLLARDILQQLGYTVLEASNGHEALEISGNRGGPIDLLLTDVIMPGMSGRELAERLRPAQPEMRVIYMSGYTADVLEPRALLEGDRLVIQKPFTAEILAQRVREALDAAPATPRVT